MPEVMTLEKAAVRINQIVQSTASTPNDPNLLACAVGPCYQIVDALDSAGSPSSTAQAGTYSNIRKTIKSYGFPDPRSNNAYLEFDPDETRVFLQMGGTVREAKSDERWLAGNYTTAATSVRATGAGVKSAIIAISGGTPAPTFTQAGNAATITGDVDISSGANVDGLVLRFRMDWRPWLTVTFSGSDPISKAAIVAAINTAWTDAGYSGTPASAPGNYLVLTSPISGEESMIEVDTTTSDADTPLGLVTVSSDFGRAYPPAVGDDFYADGVLLGSIVSVDSDTQVTLDTEHIVYTGSTPGELNATRWYIRAKNLTTPVTSGRPTPELYKNPTATVGSVRGTADLSGTSNVNGLTFKVRVDDDAETTISLTGTTESLANIVTQINLGYGSAIASAVSDHLVITSPTNGNTSRVYIGAGSANSVLGFTSGTLGEGLSVGDLEICGAFLRNTLTSAVLNPGVANIYIGYKALRKDVTDLAADPGVIRGSSADLASLEASVGPFTTENPLGLAMYLMATASPGVTITGLGVSEDSRTGYLNALALLESQSVYALVPLTEDEEVHYDFHTHCVEQSTAENSNFRVTFFSRDLPSRRVSTLAASGTDANSISSGVVQVESDLVAALVAAGITNPASMPVSDGVYMVFSGDSKRYNLSAVSGMQATGNVTFTTVGDNADGFYSTTAIPATIVGKSWSLYVRGTLIAAVSGRPDKDTIAAAHQFKSLEFSNRRSRSVCPDRAQITDGESVDMIVTGVYLAALVAAQECYLVPSQGKTNRPLPSVKRIWNSNDYFSPAQMKIIGYNNYLLEQVPAVTGSITRWHQATTDASSATTRETNITTQADWGSLVLKRGLKSFLGQTSTEDENFENLFNLTFEGLKRYIIESRVWKNLKVIEFKKVTGTKRGVYMKIQPTFYYPTNDIDIDLIVS